MERIKYVDQLAIKGDFEEIDSHFVHRILAYIPELSKEAVAAFFLLMASYRQGHLCLPLEKSSLETFLQSNSADQDLIKEILHLASTSKTVLPSEIVETSPESQEFVFKPFALFDGCLYFQRNWVYEDKIIFHLKRLLSAPKSEDSYISEGSIDSLREDQKLAVEKALQSTLCLITGGPGTGKTYTAAHIVKQFLQSKSDRAIILAAPTGKAAMRLESSFSLHEFPKAAFLSGTLHNVLQIKSWKDLSKDGVPLVADMVIVDECSMIDAGMFSCLLSRIPEGAKLILLGDDSQLAPVETGAVFADLVQYASSNSGLAFVKLINPARFEKQELIHLSEEIKAGKSELLVKLLKPLEEETLLPFLYQKMEKTFSFEELDPHHLLHAMDAYKVLSCMRKGPFGVDNLNYKMASHYFSRVPLGQYCVIPILITRTDYELDLFNGETGLLIRKKQTVMHEGLFDSEDYAVFRGKEKDKLRTIQASLLPSFEYGYCISVHKSQGSEYEEAIVIVPKGSEAFGKEVLYTGVTRARKKLEIYGDKETVLEILRRDTRKFSGIVKRLYRSI
ncbi:MAG: exodeoxyribonuclease V subunit alpha [Chlamydiae bacterium]|nr:exodeoxyribonuclease V subunit alpha [Chlamydiota bacterium]